MSTPTPSAGKGKESSMNITVKKSSSELYTIRFPEHRDWWVMATINTERGHIALSTSHGDWQNMWSCPGMPFKKFLTTLDEGYLMGKLGGRGEWFDEDATLRQLKTDVISFRREYPGTLSAKDARQIYDDLKDLDLSSVSEYQHSIERGDIVSRIYDDDYTSLPCVMDHDPSLRMFVKDLWPGLVQALKDELSQPAILFAEGVDGNIATDLAVNDECIR